MLVLAILCMIACLFGCSSSLKTASTATTNAQIGFWSVLGLLYAIVLVVILAAII